MMQPNHANMDNLQCFNSLIFNSSKSPDSAKDNGSNRPPGETSSTESSSKTGSTMPVLYASAPPTKMVSMIKTFQKDGSQSLPAPTGGDGARELVRDGGAVIRGAWYPR